MLHPYRGARPSGGAFYETGFPTKRLGHAAGGEDKWWGVHAGEDTSAVALEVLQMIEKFGLPWIRRHID